MTPDTARKRWLYAWKPASWPKTMVPFALGQAVGMTLTGRVSWWPLALGAAFTAADTIYIVLLNDWGDREVDTLKRRLFPDGCSPKTIPDGILPAGAVLRGGLLAGLAALAVAAVAENALPRPGLLPLAAGALAIFGAYTFSPLRLNYRGGGEALEALGIGVALPGVNAYLQAGALPEPGDLLVVVLPVLAGTLPMSLASAIASGLSDEVSDRRGGKRTVTSTFGNRAARRATNGLMLAGVAGWVAAALALAASLPEPAAMMVDRAWVAAACLVAAAVATSQLPALFRMSPLAVTNEFQAQGRYKAALHRAAWRSGLVLAMFLSWTAL